MALKMRVSETNGLPWSQTQDYKNLCRTIAGPGDPTTYNPAHPQGHSSTDVTQFQVGLASSNINNLPDVMYQLWPNKEWWDHTKSAKPQPKRDAKGNIMYERTPRAWAPRELLDYQILRNLDTISSEEEAWFLEMLLRMDGRIEWTDLLMRMEYPGYTEKDEQKVRNRLQQRMARFRERFVMVSWRDTAGDNNAIRDRVVDKLTPAQLAARGGLGSTRGSTPGSRDSQGRVIPVPGRRPPKTANTVKTATKVQQPQIQALHVGTSDDAIAYTECSYVNASRNTTLPTVRERRFSSDGNTRTQHGQTSTVYAASIHKQRAEYTLDDDFPRALQEPDQPSSDGDDWERNHFGSDEGGNGDDEKEDGESSDNDNDDQSDWNEEVDADVLLTEESDRLKSLTTEECRELERYLEEDCIRTQMCLNGMISVDELMLDLPNNKDKLRQGLKRTRGEICDDNKTKELEVRTTKRTRREEDAIVSSNQPLSEPQEHTCNGFNDSQSGRWGEYHRRGALAKRSHNPTTRPVGSAVERLHTDRLRHTPPKATVGQKNIYESLLYSQPGFVTDGEWTVYNCHTDSQPAHYIPQHPRGEEDLYTNIGQRRGRLTPYESRQDDILETRNPDTNAGECQAPSSSHHQRQPGIERLGPGLNPSGQVYTGDMRSHEPDGPTDGDNSYDSGSSANLEESARNDGEPIATRRAHQQSATSTVQDDPFFSDELFNGMLNGHPDNSHVASIYTRSQQQEIDEYYHGLMAPRPKAEAETNSRENPMPPPPRLRMEEPRTLFVANMLNPHSRPQARQGIDMPRLRIP